MQCPECRAENPDQAKFCLECGAKLQAACPQCGATLPPQSKFCLECGARIAPPPAVAQPAPSPPAAGARADLLAERLKRLVPQQYADRLLAAKGPAGGERRLVTVLFSDVKGSTAMAEKLDPEDVMDIMNGAFEVLIPPIYRHEGTLALLMGDAILAFFGAPLSHEDDPERAIRAALEIVAGAKEYATQLERDRDLAGFDVRVGINTGLVVMGEVGSDLRVEYAAIGDAIDLASAMEKNAPTGGILITHDTYRHVRGVFDVAPQPSLAVKPGAEPIQTYVVQRARPRAFRVPSRGLEGIETRMIGRDAELKRLQDIFYAVMEEGELQVVTVTGEAGVGKSRLLYEFDEWADLLPERFYYFQGRATQERQPIPYSLLRDLLAVRFEIQDTDPLAVVWDKMEGGFAAAGLRLDITDRRSDAAPAHLVGQLVGWNFSASPHVQSIAGDTRRLSDRALLYLGEYFQGLAGRQPVLLLLEDLHWSDDSSLDALNRLFGMLRGLPVMVVCAARPALFERRPHWGEGQLFHGRLALEPLSRRDSRRLVDEIMQKAGEVPAALRDLVVGGAEGNPFYVEELIKMLIEERVIITGDTQWYVQAERLAELEVPPTLTGVLQARLDSLPSQERAVLQQASVVGRLFWDVAVARLSTAAGASLDADTVRSVLGQLRGREMVYRRETSAFEGAGEYLFKHATLREVTYESVLKRVRQVYHGLVADWLIEQAGENTGLTAEHLERAGRMEEALVYMRRAGEEAAARYANAEAADYLGRALALTPDADSEARYELLLALERVHDLQGAREVQEQELAALEDLAALLDGPGETGRQLEVALRRARYCSVVADFPGCVAAAEKAVAFARRGGDPTGEAAGHLKWSIGLRTSAEYAAARSHLDAALSLVSQASQAATAPAKATRQVEADVVRALAHVAGDEGDAAIARTYDEQALRLYREIGDRRGEVGTLMSLGVACSNLGDYVGERAYYELALPLSREIGDRQIEAAVLGNLGFHCVILGNYAGALGFYEQDRRIVQEIGDRRSEEIGLINLGNVCENMGGYAEARGYYEQALAFSHTLGDRRMEGYALTGLGNALAGLGRLAEACRPLEQAIALRRELGEGHLATESLAALARVLLAQHGDPARALPCVEPIVAHLAAGGSLDDTEEPLRIYLTCYRVLATAGDTRARDVLNSANGILQERASRILDETQRRSYLENVPWHREIVQAAAAIPAA